MESVLVEPQVLSAKPLWEMIEWLNASYKGVYYDCEYDEGGRPVLVAYVNRDGSEIRIGQIRNQGLV